MYELNVTNNHPNTNNRIVLKIHNILQNIIISTSKQISTYPLPFFFRSDMEINLECKNIEVSIQLKNKNYVIIDTCEEGPTLANTISSWDFNIIRICCKCKNRDNFIKTDRKFDSFYFHNIAEAFPEATFINFFLVKKDPLRRQPLIDKQSLNLAENLIKDTSKYIEFTKPKLSSTLEILTIFGKLDILNLIFRFINKKVKYTININEMFFASSCRKILGLLVIKRVSEVKNISDELFYDIFWNIRFMIKEGIVPKNEGENMFEKLLKNRNENNRPKDEVLKDLNNQITLISKIKSIFKKISNKNIRKKTKRKELLKSILYFDKKIEKLKGITSPFDPFIEFESINYDGIYIYSSTTFPINIPFNTSKGEYYIIYKKGDDLTRDVFIYSIVEYISSLAESYLTVSRIIPLNRNEGLIEVIISSSISHVQSNFPNLSEFLPDKSKIEKFIESYSGYTIIMYVLGVGDRNIDNMMITNEGEFFHIDFSYLWGDDPKPFVPDIIIPDLISSFFLEDENKLEQMISSCKRWYDIMRDNIDRILLFINLLALNPYFEGDVQYICDIIKKNLKVGVSKEEADLFVEELMLCNLRNIKTSLILFANRIGKAFRE
ncbi:putative phosphatidylinositol 3-kinase VPS34 like protein [Astathelohania contejeani]|uniref:Phosphatidylinositol 3-kinase VPS34 like protein n=1 Tax=Astathelohania contejeani TaxID=164912 RepID=A0ABQ7I1U2_9MICR|nr:putative phosphatidylinositol 3-kinase VPS34 like protein [Thelohania contejeani]